jgi:hypothetical protein
MRTLDNQEWLPPRSFPTLPNRLTQIGSVLIRRLEMACSGATSRFLFAFSPATARAEYSQRENFHLQPIQDSVLQICSDLHCLHCLHC